MCVCACACLYFRTRYHFLFQKIIRVGLITKRVPILKWDTKQAFMRLFSCLGRVVAAGCARGCFKAVKTMRLQRGFLSYLARKQSIKIFLYFCKNDSTGSNLDIFKIVSVFNTEESIPRRVVYDITRLTFVL